MRKLFKKKEIFKVKSQPIDPTSIEQPSTADEFQRRGMAFYARKDYDSAEKDLRKAITLDENHIDAYYSLGMVLKAMDQKEDAIDAFQHAIELITSRVDLDKVKFDMLRRLALGHINEIKLGDWDLEKEIWQRTG